MIAINSSTISPHTCARLTEDFAINYKTGKATLLILENKGLQAAISYHKPSDYPLDCLLDSENKLNPAFDLDPRL